MSVNLNCNICFKPTSLPMGKEIGSFKIANITKTTFQYVSNPKEPAVTKCDHVFHKSCLKDWIDLFVIAQNEVPCPKCREAIISHETRLGPLLDEVFNVFVPRAECNAPDSTREELNPDKIIRPKIRSDFMREEVVSTFSLQSEFDTSVVTDDDEHEFKASAYS